MRPRAGSLILFDHSLWQAGAVVTRGVKHILRSDVLYRCEGRREGDGMAAPSGPFLPGHQGYVWTMARLDADTIASGGRDTLIRLWHGNGAAVGELAGHRQSVLGLAALAGGRLASISRDGTLRLWDVAARRCTGVVDAHEGSGLTVVALGDGTLVTGGTDGLVRHWRADGTPIAALSSHEGWVWSVAELGDGQLASASEDGTVKVWKLRSGHCLHTLQGSAPLRDIIALDNRHIACADVEGHVMTWAQHEHGWELVHAMRAHRAAVRRLRLLGDGLLASAGEDHCVRIWRLADHALVGEFCHDNFATDVLPLPSGWLSCSYDGRIARHPIPLEPR